MPIRCPAHPDYTAAVSYYANGRDGRYPVHATPDGECDGCQFIFALRHALGDGTVEVRS